MPRAGYHPWLFVWSGWGALASFYLGYIMLGLLLAALALWLLLS
jgi:hypothetical protein